MPAFFFQNSRGPGAFLLLGSLVLLLLGLPLGCGDGEKTKFESIHRHHDAWGQGERPGWDALLDAEHALDDALENGLEDGHRQDMDDASEPPDSPDDAYPDGHHDGQVEPPLPSHEGKLQLSPFLPLPWVEIGKGGSEKSFQITNLSEHSFQLSYALRAPQAIQLMDFDSEISPFGSATFKLRYEGSASREKILADLEIEAQAPTLSGPILLSSKVMAHASSALPETTWSPLQKNALLYGMGTTLSLPSAPFPYGGSPYQDSRVHVFIPSHLRPLQNINYLVHFHGHYTTIDATLLEHFYREQLYASMANFVLVLPQGPVNAASGDFGKLMEAENLELLLEDLTSLLYRDEKSPLLSVGTIVLSAHSGGYQGVAKNLEAESEGGQVTLALLFDGLYGFRSDYRHFVEAGGKLRSNHTSSGGTRAQNETLLNELGPLGSDEVTGESLRFQPAVIWPTYSGHNQSTYYLQAMSEALRWGTQEQRQGPRIRLLRAEIQDGFLKLQWESPSSQDLIGIFLETQNEDGDWEVLHEFSGGHEEGLLPWTKPHGLSLRLRPHVLGLSSLDGFPSHAYYAHPMEDPDKKVLVVNGFSRIFEGAWDLPRHAFTARVGALSKGNTASSHAIKEGHLFLSDYAAVIWILGDESLSDQSLDPIEQGLILDYLEGGGKIILGGSEIGYDLRNAGNSFLRSLGTSYVADNALSNSAKGTGPLSTLSPFSFGEEGSPLFIRYPDVLGTVSPGEVLLRYGNERVAAIGIPKKSVVLGFPLESIDQDQDLESLLEALLHYLWD